MKHIFFVTALALIVAHGLMAQIGGDRDAAGWLAQLDRNEGGISTHLIGSIQVEDRFGLKVTGFESWSQGSAQSLIVFTSGEEKGQKILRKGQTVYVAYPEADKPIKLQGAALKDSVAGSDFSYEDMAGDRSYTSRYSPTLLGQEPVGAEPCVILELKAKAPGLAYPLLKVWISQKDSSVRKLEKFSQNGRLLKTQVVEAVLVSAGRTIPSQATMTDALKTRSKTVFVVSSVELDKTIAPRQFSLEELTW